MFVIRLLSGRRNKVRAVNKRLDDPRVMAVYRHLCRALRGEGKECNHPEFISDLPEGGWEVVLKVTPHGGSYETQTYWVREREGAFHTELQS